jgi:8-oxo-dGTP pyrophosphatase MutT (NUDIX family)
VGEPRPSASVILVRDGPTGLESFMVRRNARSAVAPSAYVFPGGTVRDDDRDYAGADPSVLAASLSMRADAPVEESAASALYMCAVRELFEEAGVFLVRDAAGKLLSVGASEIATQERLESLRLALQAQELVIGDVLNENGWSPAFDQLVPFSRWITPRAVAVRFDTHFFIAQLPPGQSALHDTVETSEGVWLSPSRALESDYHTVFPTEQHLRRLARFRRVADLVEFARTKSIFAVMPEVGQTAAGRRAFIRPEIAETW